MPRKYRYLLDWYEDDYANRNRGAIGSLPLGVAVADLLRLAGTISKNDSVKMKTVIAEDCERIDAD